MTRSRFGLSAASVIALGTRSARASGTVQVPPQPAATLSLHWTVDFDPGNAVLGSTGPGTASLTIDRGGAWAFAGSFGPQPKLVTPYAVTVAIAVKATAPAAQIVAFSKSLTLTSAGAGWQKIGTDPLLAALVQSIAKSGYAWRAVVVSRAILPNAAPPPDGSVAASAQLASALSGSIAVTF